MKAVRVTEEWQRAGVHYVRTQAMCLGFKIPLEGEFSDDTPEDEYILVMDGIYPVSTCKGVTKIYINSRKAALGFYEKLGYTADFSQISGSGEFECVMTEKELA